MRLRILHPGEDHLGSRERVGDHCFQNLLRERCGKLPWWGETLGLILVACEAARSACMRSCSALDSAISSCSPRIMSMTCCMDISSVAARAEPCLVALILQCFPPNFSSRYGSSDRFPETCGGTDVLNRSHGGRQMFRPVDLGTSLCATLPVSYGHLPSGNL